MIQPMAIVQRENKTFICSVVFLDIANYSTQTVSEQSRLKQRLNENIAEAIKDVAINDRIILDTGDGAAISFLGDPEDALFVAMTLRDFLAGDPEKSVPPLPVRFGINLGPAKLVKDLNQQSNLIGDGINVAQRVMSFAQPGQILVSRSFYEVVSCISEEYARLFHYLGMKADKHIREHQVYSVEKPGAIGAAPGGGAVATNSGRPQTVQESISALKALKATLKDIPRPDLSKTVRKAEKEFRRGWLIYGTIPVAVVLVIVAVIMLRKPKTATKVPPVSNPDSELTQLYKDAKADIKKLLSGKPGTTTPAKKVAEKPEKKAESARPESLPELDLKPAEVQKPSSQKLESIPIPAPDRAKNERSFILIHAASGCQVYIDDRFSAMTTRLTKIPIVPGDHKLQILSPEGRSFKVDITIRRGEMLEIKTPFI